MQDDTALQYIYTARNQSDMESMNHIKLLSDGSVYFRKDFQKEVDFKNYDSTITMTKYDIIWCFTGIIQTHVWIIITFFSAWIAVQLQVFSRVILEFEWFLQYTLKCNDFLGSAFVGKICSPSLNTGFIKDDSNFGGVISATHELGHLWVHYSTFI